MSDRIDPRDARIDTTQLYREDVITDRRIGTIRVLHPITPDGGPDSARATQFIGEVQMVTQMGALPISFELAAPNLAAAIELFPMAARDAFERTMQEIQDMRRQAASSIVVPPSVGGGKIQMP